MATAGYIDEGRSLCLFPILSLSDLNLSPFLDDALHALRRTTKMAFDDLPTCLLPPFRRTHMY